MAMQAKALITLVLALALGGALPLAAGEWRGGGDWGGHGGDGRGGGGPDRPDDRRRPDGGPSIFIEPNIDLSRRPKQNPDTAEFVLAEIQRCVSFGVRPFVDCLRDNHSSVMIRRLEACVGSETIPDDPRAVMPCLPMGPMPTGSASEGQ